MPPARSWVLLLLAAACEPPGEAFRLEAVEPGSAVAGVRLPVTIRGQGFHPSVRISYDDEARSRIDTGFSARLGGHELSDVSWTSSTTLSATVPRALGAGAYDLEVTAPSGARQHLAGAFVVRALAPAQVVQQSSDVLGDGSPFACVIELGGELLAGPRADGRGAVRIEAGSPTPLDFRFARDATGSNVHDNRAPSPYPSIGWSGCAEHTEECGPDNENGRGLFAVATFSGASWLVLGGARDGSALEYVYMSTGGGPSVDFRYVDLAQLLDGRTSALTALHALGERLYLGFAGTGGGGPSLLALRAAPDAPGLNVAPASSCNAACDLDAAALGQLSASGATALIDVIAGFHDRLYVANAGDWVRSTVDDPSPAARAPSDWLSIRPSAPAWSAAASLLPSRVADLEPADRSVPAMVSFGDRLFAARNTESGPQLWMCAPETVSEPAPATSRDCESGDWQLLAPDAADDRLTRFGNLGLERISLLAATATHLYVGFDSATGVILFRTADPLPQGADAFEGDEGCNAADHPVSCDGIGGKGFRGGRRRILSWAVSSADLLFMVTGGDGPAQLHRL